MRRWVPAALEVRWVQAGLVSPERRWVRVRPVPPWHPVGRAGRESPAGRAGPRLPAGLATRQRPAARGPGGPCWFQVSGDSFLPHFSFSVMTRTSPRASPDPTHDLMRSRPSPFSPFIADAAVPPSTTTSIAPPRPASGYGEGPTW
ncbi:hypothetical protein ACFQZ4_07055 [Catellatospora coxensis]